MGADHRVHIVDHHLLDAHAPLHFLFHILGVFQAIAVADEDHLPGRVNGRLLHVVHQGVQGGPPPFHFAHSHQVAFVIHMHHRLDAQHRARHSSRGGNAAAPL